jgi:hypothetical protein
VKKKLLRLISAINQTTPAFYVVIKGKTVMKCGCEPLRAKTKNVIDHFFKKARGQDYQVGQASLFTH